MDLPVPLLDEPLPFCCPMALADVNQNDVTINNQQSTVNSAQNMLATEYGHYYVANKYFYN